MTPPLPFEPTLVVHQGRFTAYRRLLFHEVWKVHLNERIRGIQSRLNLAKNLWELTECHLAANLIEHLNETAHVRALELLRQSNVGVDRRNRVLFTVFAVQNPNGVAKPFDAHPVDRECAVILFIRVIGQIDFSRLHRHNDPHLAPV